MEDVQPKTGKFSLIYGLILGGIATAFAIMLYTMDAHTSRDTTNTIINIVLAIAVIIWGIIAFKKANGGYLSLKEALKLGAGIALIAGVISIIWIVFLSNVLDTDFVTKVAELNKSAAEQAGVMSQEQINQQYEGTINYFWVSYPFILLGNILTGLVIGLIGGLILKKAKPAY
jgi:hypothetical protein